MKQNIILKSLRFKAILSVALLFIISTGSTWGQTITWERVTSTQTLFDGGTFIMGYEDTAKSDTIIPLRSKDSNATTSANGYFNTGTTANSSNAGTLNMSNLTGVTTSDYEVYITGVKVVENNNEVYKYINIQRNNSSGNYYGATSGGTASNKGRLYTSGNSSETNLLPEWSSETNNQFKLTANVSGNYKYLKYNTGSPRFAFYNSAGEKIVFYKKVVKYTITYSATNGNIEGVVDGTTTAVASGASIAQGSKVTLTAHPAEGFAFYSWNVSGTGSTLSSTSTNPTTFTMGSANAIVTANFISSAYTITAQSNNNSYGTVVLNGTVITASPNSGYRLANPAYTVSSGSAEVVQNGNKFTVTPSSNCTITIHFEAIPTHTVTFSVNGSTTSQSVEEGAAITFPNNPDNISGKSFVGWTTATISGTTNTAPTFVNSCTMGESDITYYAVFADIVKTYSESETEKTQSLVYDDWTYSGTTTDKTSYRLFSENAYIVSGTFDLSILKQVDVYAGTFGTLDNDKKKVTVRAGETTWGTATLSTNSQSTKNEITSSVSLSGNGQLHIVAGGGDGSNSGIRISKVEIYTKKVLSTNISNYCTTVVITYSVTYDGNGATSGTVPTDDTAYTSGQSVTVLGNTGNLAKPSYAFGGWNTQADGNGTTYAANETFSIAANTTLYAKWNTKTATGLSYTGTPTKTTYNAGESFDSTGLTVTATYNDASQEDVTDDVTWTPNPLTKGTTSVTGTYMELSVIVSGLTVNSAPGDADNPYTVSQARSAIDAASGSTLSDKYVSGLISQVDSYNSTYKSITYWISDDGTTTNQLQVYSGKDINGADFSAVTDVELGATVVVKGNLKKFNSTYEFDYNNELVSYTAPAPAISSEDVDIDYNANGGSIVYAVSHPVEGGSISATTTSTWISLSDNYASPIAFTCGANTMPVSRTATVTLTYTYNTNETITKDVTITQAAYIATSASSGNWVLTSLADLTETDVFVIVGDNGSTYALSSSNGTGGAPAASSITIKDNMIDETKTPVTDALMFNIGGNATDGYVFFPNGSTSSYIYTTDANNGVRVGKPNSNTTEIHEFTITDGYLSAGFSTARYLGIYNSQDWRAYTSKGSESNIASQTFSFYKYTVDLTLSIDEANITSTSAMVSWNNGDKASYTVQLDNEDTFETPISSTTVSGNSYIFKDLTPGTTYYARVDGSAPVSFTTLADNAASIIRNAVPFECRYWTTFYKSNQSYKLENGVQAFTMHSDNKLYLLGENGRVIPEGTAVIIIADKASITLTECTSSISDNDNILVGSDTGVDVPDGMVCYVLGIENSAMGFYRYSGTSTPAEKAYILE